jgi:tetratricopeptide (TPR) repeat protein
MLKLGIALCALLSASFSSQLHAGLEEAASKNADLIYQGRIREFGDRLLAAGDAADKTHLLQVGNVIYRLDLPRTIKLHEQALTLSPGDPQILLELAFDYTAAERCPDAVKAWNAVRIDHPIVNAYAAIAAYCYVSVGEYDQAVELWAQAKYFSHHISIEKGIHNVFARPSTQMTHADGFRAYVAKGWGGAGEWVRNAIFWQDDWWNQASNQLALKSIRAALKSSGDDEALRELACALAMENLSPAKALQAAKDCGFLETDDPTPRNSGVAYAAAVQIGAAHFATLNEQWGDELVRRAKRGDLEALKLAAALRAHVGDSVSLADIDELGWTQFKLPQFALSRLYRLGVTASGEVSDALAKRLADAEKSFPFDARLKMLSIVNLRVTGVAFRDATAHLILAEYHSLAHSSQLSAQPNARGLDGFFAQLNAAQERLAEVRMSPSVAPAQ